MIKVITFDFWATLYQSKQIDYRRRLQEFKTLVEQNGAPKSSLDEFKAAVKVARRTWNDVWEQDHRTLKAEDWLDIILNELDITLPAPRRNEVETYLEHTVLRDAPTPAPAAKEALSALSQDYRLGIISDTGVTPGRVLRQILERDGILGYFSHCTFSDELGRSKPHPDTFLTTLAALGAGSEQAVHVGDIRRTDIAGAHGVGMRAVQYIALNNDQSNHAIPDAVIESHADLPPLLRRWQS